MPPIKRREKATPPKGESNATQKDTGEQKRHPKERGGKVALFKMETGWEATHAKENGQSAAPRRIKGRQHHPKKAASPLIFWSGGAFHLSSLFLLFIYIFKDNYKFN